MSEVVDKDHEGSRASLWLEENLRRVARGATRQIALRRGTDLHMWVGCGYPKSGTVWMCKLMGTTLGLSVPVDYQMPIMMPAVVHAHWAYDSRMPPAVYIRRDGRDVTVSMYFFWTKLLKMKRDPRVHRNLLKIFTELYGPSFDPEDVQGNMPRFIEYQMTVAPTTHGITWQQHVSDWWDRPRVGHVTYEGLLQDPAAELSQALMAASGQTPDPDALSLAVARHSFASESGRKAGQEDRASFLRKGMAGDWREHFTREACEAFDSYAGAELIEFGYEQNRDWYRDR